MKKLFTLFFSIILIHIVSAQAPAIEWQNAYGGTKQDIGATILQTYDGGYIMKGFTYSNDGDVVGQHSTGSLSNDTWVVKLSDTGSIQWQICLGGTSWDDLVSFIGTTDSGYIVTGRSCSVNGNVIGNHGACDAWVVKLTRTGIIQWQRCVGGTYADDAVSVRLTRDDGYIVAGSTYSIDGDVVGLHGTPANNDIMVFKLGASGNLQWLKCLGGTNNETPVVVEQTNDGGYITAGGTVSNDGDVIGNHGGVDIWIVKLDSSGNLQWQKCFGGTSYDVLTAFLQTTGGGFIAAGKTNSNNGDVSGNHGNNTYDGWVVKLDSSGSIQWQKCFGGALDDEITYIKQTTDGGYIVVLNNGEVIKLNSSGIIEWTPTPNLTDPYLHIFEIQLTNENGYILGGYLGNPASALLVKLDSSGFVQWQQIYVGGLINSILKNATGDYVIGGQAGGNVPGYHGGGDIWVMKLFPDVSSNCTAHFTIYPDSSNQGVYWGYNQSIGNNLTYVWHFGDGDSSTLQYPSHTYPAPGQYYVCLTVNNGAGCVNTYCDSSYLVFKTEGGLMSQLNILDPSAPVGVKEVSTNLIITVYPNPATNQLTINLDGLQAEQVSIYNVDGKLVSTAKQPKNNSLDISGLAPGVYIAEVKGRHAVQRVRWVKM